MVVTKVRLVLLLDSFLRSTDCPGIGRGGAGRASLQASPSPERGRCRSDKPHRREAVRVLARIRRERPPPGAGRVSAGHWTWGLAGAAPTFAWRDSLRDCRC